MLKFCSPYGKRKDYLVNPGSKASIKGIREGDLITSINGQSTKDVTNSEAHSLLKSAGDKLKLGLNEEGTGSPKRRQYNKTVLQETHSSETTKRSSVTSSTSYSVTSNSCTATTNQESAEETSPTVERTNSVEDKGNGGARENGIASQRSTLSSNESTPSTNSSDIKGAVRSCDYRSEDCDAMADNASGNSRSKRRRRANRKRSKKARPATDNSSTEQHEDVRDAAHGDDATHEDDDTRESDAEEEIITVAINKHMDIVDNYRVESPQPPPIKTKPTKPNNGTVVKSRSLDDEEMLRITEISESDCDEKSSECSAIVAEADSDVEWENTEELAVSETKFTTLSIDLQKPNVEQVSLISPEEEKSLRDFLQSINLVTCPQRATANCNKAETIKAKRKKKREQLAQYFMPVYQNPRFLDAISEENSDLSDKEQKDKHFMIERHNVQLVHSPIVQQDVCYAETVQSSSHAEVVLLEDTSSAESSPSDSQDDIEEDSSKNDSVLLHKIPGFHLTPPPTPESERDAESTNECDILNKTANINDQNNQTIQMENTNLQLAEEIKTDNVPSKEQLTDTSISQEAVKIKSVCVDNNPFVSNVLGEFQEIDNNNGVIKAVIKIHDMTTKSLVNDNDESGIIQHIIEKSKECKNEEFGRKCPLLICNDETKQNQNISNRVEILRNKEQDIEISEEHFEEINDSNKFSQNLPSSDKHELKYDDSQKSPTIDTTQTNVTSKGATTQNTTEILENNLIMDFETTKECIYNLEHQQVSLTNTEKESADNKPLTPLPENVVNKEKKHGFINPIQTSIAKTSEENKEASTESANSVLNNIKQNIAESNQASKYLDEFEENKINENQDISTLSDDDLLLDKIRKKNMEFKKVQDKSKNNVILLNEKSKPSDENKKRTKSEKTNVLSDSMKKYFGVKAESKVSVDSVQNLNSIKNKAESMSKKEINIKNEKVEANHKKDLKINHSSPKVKIENLEANVPQESNYNTETDLSNTKQNEQFGVVKDFIIHSTEDDKEQIDTNVKIQVKKIFEQSISKNTETNTKSLSKGSENVENQEKVDSNIKFQVKKVFGQNSSKNIESNTTIIPVSINSPENIIDKIVPINSEPFIGINPLNSSNMENKGSETITKKQNIEVVKSTDLTKCNENSTEVLIPITVEELTDNRKSTTGSIKKQTEDFKEAIKSSEAHQHTVISSKYSQFDQKLANRTIETYPLEKDVIETLNFSNVTMSDKSGEKHLIDIKLENEPMDHIDSTKKLEKTKECNITTKLKNNVGLKNSETIEKKYQGNQETKKANYSREHIIQIKLEEPRSETKSNPVKQISESVTKMEEMQKSDNLEERIIHVKLEDPCNSISQSTVVKNINESIIHNQEIRKNEDLREHIIEVKLEDFDTCRDMKKTTEKGKIIKKSKGIKERIIPIQIEENKKPNTPDKISTSKTMKSVIKESKSSQETKKCGTEREYIIDVKLDNPNNVAKESIFEEKVIKPSNRKDTSKRELNFDNKVEPDTFLEKDKQESKKHIETINPQGKQITIETNTSKKCIKKSNEEVKEVAHSSNEYIIDVKLESGNNNSPQKDKANFSNKDNSNLTGIKKETKKKTESNTCVEESSKKSESINEHIIHVKLDDTYQKYPNKRNLGKVDEVKTVTTLHNISKDIIKCAGVSIEKCVNKNSSKIENNDESVAKEYIIEVKHEKDAMKDTNNMKMKEPIKKNNGENKSESVKKERHEIFYDGKIETEKGEYDSSFKKEFKEVFHEQENVTHSIISRESSASSDTSVGTTQCTVICNPMLSSIGDVNSILTDVENVNAEGQLHPESLKEICVQTLMSLPFGADVLEELAAVSQSLEEYTNKLPKTQFHIHPATKSSFTVPADRSQQGMIKSDKWIGLTTESSEKPLICLSPTHMEFPEGQRRPHMEKDTFLELHEKFLNQRSFNKQFKEDFKKGAVRDENRLLKILRCNSENPSWSKVNSRSSENLREIPELKRWNSMTLPREGKEARLKARDLSEWLQLARGGNLTIPENKSSKIDRATNNLMEKRAPVLPPRRRSLPHELFVKQMQYLIQKEKEIQQELEVLEQEKRDLASEMYTTKPVPIKQFEPNDYKISKNGDIAELDESKMRSTPIPCEGNEKFRQVMYEEYMDKVAAREERKHKKVIKISMHSEDNIEPKLTEHVNNDIEHEFMDKVKKRMDKYGLQLDDTQESENEGEKRVLIMDGDEITEAKKLPKHLREFVDIAHQNEDGLNRKRRDALRICRALSRNRQQDAGSLLHEIDADLVLARGFLFGRGLCLNNGANHHGNC